MREIERRVRKLEDLDPARREERFAISDCPEGDVEVYKQIRHAMNGGRVIYLLKEHVMSDEEWAETSCTAN